MNSRKSLSSRAKLAKAGWLPNFLGQRDECQKPMFSYRYFSEYAISRPRRNWQAN